MKVEDNELANRIRPLKIRGWERPQAKTRFRVQGCLRVLNVFIFPTPFFNDSYCNNCNCGKIRTRAYVMSTGPSPLNTGGATKVWLKGSNDTTFRETIFIYS